MKAGDSSAPDGSRQLRRGAVVLAVALLSGMFGFIQGFVNADVSSARKAQSCSAVLGGDTGELEIEVSMDAKGEPVQPLISVAARVPTTWWEIDALRAPGTNTAQQGQAMRCLIGRFNGRPREVSVNTSGATTTVSTNRRRLQDLCAGPWQLKLEYRLLRVLPANAKRCNTDGTLLTAAGTRVIVRAVVTGTRGVLLRPPPTREEGDLHEWAWVAPSGSSPQLEVPLRFSSWATTFQQTANPQLGGLHVSVAGMTGQLPVVVAAFLLIVVFRSVKGRNRQALENAVLALFALILGASVTLSRGGLAWALGFPVLVGLGIAAMFCIWGRWLLVLTTVALVQAAALQLAYVPDDFAVHVRHIRSALAGAVAVALVAVIVVKQWSWLTAPLPKSPLLARWTLGDAGTGDQASGSASTSGGYGASLLPLPWPRIRPALAVAMAVAFGYMLGQTAVSVWFLPAASWTFVGILTLPTIIEYLPLTLAALAFLVVCEVVARQWKISPPEPTGWVRPPGEAVIGIGLIWGLMAGPNHPKVYGVTLPVGLLLLAAGLYVLLTARDVTVLRWRVERSALNDPDCSRSLLDHGPTGTWKGNLRWALEIGAIVALLPVGYFTWAGVGTLPSLASPVIVASVIREGARWLATAAIFGLLYPYLPGRIGPLKAAALAGLWFGAGIITELVNRWAGHGTGRVWTFPGLQILLFLLVLSSCFDYVTVRAAGGGWHEFQLAYGIDRRRDAVLFVVPVALAVLAIAQQVTSGTGADFVKVVLEGLPKVVSPLAPGR